MASNPDGSGLVPSLRDVHPSHRRCPVSTGFRKVQKILEVLVQVLRELPRALPVDSDCPILAGQPVGLSHPFQVDVVRQRRQHLPRHPSRQFRYALSFRTDRRGARYPHGLSLQRIMTPAPPSLRRIPWGGFPGFIGTMGRSDSLSPVPLRFVSFAPRYHRAPSRSLPRGRGTSLRGPGLWSSGFPHRLASSRRKRQGLPSSRATPLHACHAPPTPRGPPRQTRIVP